MAWLRQRSRSAGTTAHSPAEPPLDTVGNPIVQRSLGAPGTGHPAPSRAEHRVLQFVTEGRVAVPLDAPRSAAGAATGGFWLIDDALATGTKAMMLDWLLEQGFIAKGPRGALTSTVVLTARGRELVRERL